MGSFWSSLLLLTLWCVGYVAADGGDDFANNLFSDLAPILSLFGERVSMQFMSQAIGLADCILLAMAPLGIITTIVSAIRVGGPTWLKAVIGRARENLSAAEVELMSSTSKEACELWNGRNVIRCQGSARIWQFICLVEECADAESQAHHSDEIEYKTLKEALQSGLIEPKCITGPKHAYDQLKDLLSSLRGAKEERRENDDVELASMDNISNASSAPSKKHRKVTIIRDSDLDAPNLSLNCHNRVGRAEIYLMAAIGTLLQIGVLVFFGFITLYAPIKSHFQKNNNPVANYAFPCALIGTIFLVTGMFLCALVIEQSTIESFYAPTMGNQAWIVWLQKSHVVNDQVFQPYAIYPTSNRTFITTSRRSPELDEQQHDKFKYLGLETLTFVGTTSSLIGFIVQFVGLRGLNWSASVVQLGAVILMTCARTWVRRGLAEPPISSRLTSDFELDWLALSLKDCKNAPWMKDSGKDKVKDQGKNPDSDSAEETIETWTIYSGQERYFRALKKGSNESSSRRSVAQEAMVIRKELGNLSNWQGPASAEAVRLSEVIEAVADTFLAENKGPGPKTYNWILPVRYTMANQPTTSEDDNQLITTSKNDQISIQLTHNGRGWEIPTGDIEAALSLWMYSIRKQERAHGQGQDLERPDPQNRNARLRFRGERKLGLRLFGPACLKTPLFEDLAWWMPEAAPEVLTLEDIVQFKSTSLIPDGRVVGFTQQRGLGDGFSDDHKKLFIGVTSSKGRSRNIEVTEDEDEGEGEGEEHSDTETSEDLEQVDDDIEERGTLAVECYDPLERLLSRDMLFAFIVAVSRSSPAFSNRKASVATAIDYENIARSWIQPRLHDSDLSQLAQKLEAKGFGTLSEAYFDLIVPLSIERKLPNIDGLIEMAQKQAQEHEISQQWEDLVEVSSWLLGLAMRLDQIKDCAWPRIIAICLDIFRRMDIAENLQSVEGRFDGGRLSYKKNKLGQILADARLPNLSLFHTLIGSGDPKWNTGILQDKKVLHGPVIDIVFSLAESFRMTLKHMTALENTKPTLWTNDTENLDSFGWSPFYYEVQKFAFTNKISSAPVSRLNKQADFRGWTPLHYFCLQGKDYSVQKLIEAGHNQNAAGSDGVTPMHCAAKNGDTHVVRSLLQSRRGYVCESQGGRRYRDHNERAPIHWAAVEGHVEVTEALKPDINLEDRFGWTPLHIAAVYGHKELVEFITKETHANKDQQDHDLHTPLHLAVKHGRDQVVKVLLEAGADVNRASITGRTPLHLAVGYGHKELVEYIIKEAKVNIDQQDHSLHTPLHLAVKHGRDQVVKVLLEANADVNRASSTGRTPLHLATTEEIAKLLLENQADMNRTENCNRTPLRLAILDGRDQIARVLLEAGADVHEVLSDGDTLLHEARTKESVQLLIQSGVKVDRTNHSGCTPLHYATDQLLESSEVAHALVEAGADVNIPDAHGCTPLQWAAENCPKEIVKLLLDKGADTTACDEDGALPLHHAVNGKNLDNVRVLAEHDKAEKKVVQFRDSKGNTALHTILRWYGYGDISMAIANELLKMGFDVNAKNNMGQTPLDIARKRGECDFEKALLKAGARSGHDI